MGQFVKAAKAADLANGKLRCVNVAGRPIVLFVLGKEIFAIGGLEPQEHAAFDSTAIDVLPRNQRWNSDRSAAADPVERHKVRTMGDDVEIEI